MATNPPSGDNHRNGAVRSRSQTFNPRTQQFVKRNAETGRFMDVKQNGTPFKGIDDLDITHPNSASDGSAVPRWLGCFWEKTDFDTL